MAEIEAPPGRQPPPRSPSGSSDMSAGGLAKAVGGCCVTCCFLYCGVVFLLVGSVAFMFPPLGLPFALIGAICCVVGAFAAKWEWDVLKGLSG